MFTLAMLTSESLYHSSLLTTHTYSATSPFGYICLLLAFHKLKTTHKCLQCASTNQILSIEMSKCLLFLMAEFDSSAIKVMCVDNWIRYQQCWIKELLNLHAFGLLAMFCQLGCQNCFSCTPSRHASILRSG